MRTFLEVVPQSMPFGQHDKLLGSQCSPTGQQTAVFGWFGAEQMRSPAQQVPPWHVSPSKQSPLVTQLRLPLTHLRGLFFCGRAQT
jgi:hypothetical protein